MSMKIWIEGTRQFGCQSKLALNALPGLWPERPSGDVHSRGLAGHLSFGQMVSPSPRGPSLASPRQFTLSGLSLRDPHEPRFVPALPVRPMGRIFYKDVKARVPLLPPVEGVTPRPRPPLLSLIEGVPHPSCRFATPLLPLRGNSPCPGSRSATPFSLRSKG